MKNLDLDIAYRSGGTLAADLGSIIEQAKSVACRAVDVALVYRNWLLGKRIAEEELRGAGRAEYGKAQLAALADELTDKYGPGFDFGSLYKYLAFFKRFKILDSLSPKSGRLLSWTHYRHLLQVESDEALRWYLDEAAAEAWSVRTLQRNISSQYYERTLLAQSKDAVHAEMVSLTKPLQQKLEFIKNPVIRWVSCFAPTRTPTSPSIRSCTAANSSSRRSTGFACRAKKTCAGRSRRRSRRSSTSTRGRIARTRATDLKGPFFALTRRGGIWYRTRQFKRQKKSERKGMTTNYRMKSHQTTE